MYISLHYDIMLVGLVVLEGGVSLPCDVLVVLGWWCYVLVVLV